MTDIEFGKQTHFFVQLFPLFYGKQNTSSHLHAYKKNLVSFIIRTTFSLLIFWGGGGEGVEKVGTLPLPSLFGVDIVGSTYLKALFGWSGEGGQKCREGEGVIGSRDGSDQKNMTNYDLAQVATLMPGKLLKNLHFTKMCLQASFFRPYL